MLVHKEPDVNWLAFPAVLNSTIIIPGGKAECLVREPGATLLSFPRFESRPDPFQSGNVIINNITVSFFPFSFLMMIFCLLLPLFKSQLHLPTCRIVIPVEKRTEPVQPLGKGTCYLPNLAIFVWTFCSKKVTHTHVSLPDLPYNKAPI